MLRKIVVAITLVLLTAGCGSAATSGQASSDEQASAVAGSDSPADAGSGSPADAGSGSPADAGSGSPADAGSGSPADGGSGSPAGGGTGSEGGQTLDCNSLSGGGTFSNPYQLGEITGQVIVAECPSLTPGSPYNSRYFSFTLPDPPGSNVSVQTSFTLSQDALGPVYIDIDDPNGFIIKNAFNGSLAGDDPNFTGFYQSISGLNAGTYILLAEKADSPLHSARTPLYDVVIDPGYSS